MANQLHEIVYNLEYYEGFSYMPSAFVTTYDKEGKLTYVQHKVTADTLNKYEVKSEEVHHRLLEIVDRLQIPVLEKKFHSRGRKIKPLATIVENPTVKKAIQEYIHQELDLLLTGVMRYRLCLCLDARRKDWIRDIYVKIGRRKLVPDLHFTKKREGVYYQMKLNNGEFTWRISNRDVKVVTNHPAWIIINNFLYKVADINGNMVKPFMRKNELFIKKSFVKEYFQKFIVKIIPKANVTADGFQIKEYKKVNAAKLSLTQNFMTKEFGVKLIFDYGKVEFEHYEQAKNKTKLEFNSVHDIIIHQYKRNPLVEREYIDLLNSLGLNDATGHHFKLEKEDEDKPVSIVEWLATHTERLESKGFQIEAPTIDNKKVVMAVPKLQLNLQQINDWFDIYGVIEVAGFTIPFHALAQYIRTYEQFYPLPNGAYFIIPEEWMERYQALFQIAKIRKEAVRLGKSQFPILQGLKFDKADEKVQEELQKDFKDIDYSTPDSLNATLRPYQIEGVKWLIHLYHNQLGACLADDMGLGKTLQTIAMLLYAKEQKAVDNKKTNKKPAKQLGMFSAHQEALKDFAPLNALVILPASLVFNWEEEIKKFAPQLSVYRHVGSKRNRKVELLQGFDVMLTTYHTALRDVDFLKEITFEYIILDESQQIKNKDSKIFKAINELQALHKVSLSGTPIENSLSDLWSQMQFINPDLLGGYTFFKKAFIKPIERQQDEVQKERLKSLIAPYMLRRTKESVAKDLPELTYKVFYSEMSVQQKKLYEREKSAARNYILDNFDNKSFKFNNVVLTTLMKLRQIANHPLLVSDEYNYKSGKFQDIIEMLEVIKKGGHKTLIFSQFVSHLALFKEFFEKGDWKYSWLTGKNTSKERQQAIKDFQGNEAINAFLISLKAGGTGLNLTAADYVFITDPWWNPSAERQAIARAHRIGQTKNVIAVKFITKDSIEEKILKLQERKRQLAEDIIENNEKIQFSKKDLSFLLE